MLGVVIKRVLHIAIGPEVSIADLIVQPHEFRISLFPRLVAHFVFHVVPVDSLDHIPAGRSLTGVSRFRSVASVPRVLHLVTGSHSVVAPLLLTKVHIP